ncbi:MAG: Tad domain-containing protein [Gammaproteobacteria bacterium]
MKKLTLKKDQRGAVLVLFMAGAVVILGMAGMAMDMGHVYLNKTRLQNALDASALSGAKTINEGSSIAQARGDALSTFNEHLEGEFAEANLDPVFEFSQTLVPFVAGAVESEAKYIRARVDNFSVGIGLARLLPGVGNNQNVNGTAVAGPSPPLGTGGGEICDIAPLLMCGDPADTDCSDGECYGYGLGAEEEIVLKTHAGNQKKGWEVGPGNFQLLELGCGPGGSCIREELAGGYSGCATPGDTVTTKPGNTVGPVAQGFNTRFGTYTGGMSSAEYPSDTVTVTSNGGNDIWYDDYMHKQRNGIFDEALISDGGIGVPMRRILTVPIGNCTGTSNGRGEVSVLGFGCFYMTRKASHSGKTQNIYGQFIESCNADGTIGEDPTGPGIGPHLYKVILYKDPDSVAS